MTDLTPIECEARLVGLSKQRRKDGDWVEVKFHIHPNEHPAALFILPLGTQCMLGVKGIPENDDETTTAEQPEQIQERAEQLHARRPWNELSAVTQSGIRCTEEPFQSFLKHKYPDVWRSHIDMGGAVDVAAGCVRWICGGLTSRRQLAAPDNITARSQWTNLDAEFRASQHGQLPEQMESMR